MTKNSIGIIFEEAFKVFFVGYLLFLIIETLKSGFITNFFNINIILLLVLVTGIGRILLGSKVQEKNIVEDGIDWYVIVAFSVFSGAIVYYKTKEMGNVSLVVSAISAVAIFLLSYLTLSDKE